MLSGSWPSDGAWKPHPRGSRAISWAPPSIPSEFGQAASGCSIGELDRRLSPVPRGWPNRARPADPTIPCKTCWTRGPRP